MTSEHSMLNTATTHTRASTFAARLMPVLGVCVPLVLAACKSEPKLTPPPAVVAPYDAARGEALWAVAPLRNESGTTHADALAISDQLVAAAEEVQGVRCVPLNRSIEAMRALKMAQVQTPEDAMLLAETLGAQGILIGSITAYDPYTPSIGLSVALAIRPGSLQPSGETRGIDSRAVTSQTRDNATSSNFGGRPASATSQNYDGKNHQVLADVKAYATGRHEEPTALGWQRYVKSMELFTEFATHDVVRRLIEQERVRLGKPALAPEAGGTSPR